MQHPELPRSPSNASRKVLLGLMICVAVLTLSVPFFYPTETLWYKFGLDKVLLQAGQVAGLLTLLLLVLQILFALRPRLLEQAFGGPVLMRWHRTNGVMVAFSATAHVFLVLVPEGLAHIPIGLRFWPELLGAIALLLLLITVALSHFRARLQLNYQRWRMIHRPLGHLILLLLVFHVLFVSESFASGLPRIGLITVFIGLVINSGLVWIRRGRATPAKKNPV